MSVSTYVSTSMTCASTYYFLFTRAFTDRLNKYCNAPKEDSSYGNSAEKKQK